MDSATRMRLLRSLEAWRRHRPEFAGMIELTEARLLVGRLQIDLELTTSRPTRRVKFIKQAGPAFYRLRCIGCDGD